MHSNSLLLFEKYALPHFTKGMKILEIGPNRVPSSYCSMVGDAGVSWHTLDIYESPDLTYSASSTEAFPVPDGEYDLVLSGQVIEHVQRIWAWMAEVARVTKPGGKVITISPVSWPYHEAPIDCWRLYPDALKVLIEDAGLTMETCHHESLELPQYPNAIPGRSPEYQPVAVRRMFSLLGRFGFPVEKSFDCISIATKPQV
jgi:SAM-dependent methyltransferase